MAVSAAVVDQWEAALGLETGNFIADLVPTNPPSGDLVTQGDDHIRLLKQVLKNTFPGATRAFAFPVVATRVGGFTVLSTDAATTFIVDTSGGAATILLPALVSTDAGWECFFLRGGAGLNPMLIGPPTGNIQSGILSLTRTRRCIPGVRTRVFWTGSNWIADRALGQPVGTVLDFSGATLPSGYEWPNGQSLNTTSYPDYATGVSGSGLTHDLRGTNTVGRDDMGGTAAGRVTTAGSGVDGVTLGARGGAEAITLDISRIPNHAHGGVTGTDYPDHTHAYSRATSSGNQKPSSGGTAPFDTYDGPQTGGASTRHQHNITAEGGGLPHSNMPPSLIMNKILVVE